MLFFFFFKTLVPINIWENILVALDTFNFDIICILGQVPRSDMSSYWIIILHTRILEALFFLVKVLTRGPFSAISPLDKHWWSSGEVEAMGTEVSKPCVLPNQHAMDLCK